MATTEISQQVKFGTTAQWAASTVALLQGEFGMDTDTREIRMGDGSTLWGSLPNAITKILSGTAAPTTEGVDGDFYIRTTTSYLYGPKASGTWPAGVSLVGATGSAGADGSGLTIGRTITDAAIIADATVLNITSADYGTQIIWEATAAHDMTVIADIGVYTAIPQVQIYLKDATAFPTVIAETGGAADMILRAPSGGAGLEQFGYMALQMNEQSATYPGGDWRLDVSAAAAAPSGGVSISGTQTEGELYKRSSTANTLVPAVSGVDYAAPVAYSQSVPVYLISGGSITNADGTFTLTTALGEIYTDGVYLIVDADRLKAGSAAGAYFAIMTSTTEGKFYQDMYTPGTNLPTIPASPTAWTDLTVAAFAGATAYFPVASFSKAAGILGINGTIDIDAFIVANNTVGNKMVRMTYGGSTMFTNTRASYNRQRITARLQNTGNAAMQRGFYVYDGSSVPVNTATLDDASAQDIVVLLSKATADDMVGVVMLSGTLSHRD